jgi:N-formylglutamate deformylase
MKVLPYFVREPAAPAVPLLVSIPHTGTEVPAEIAARFAGPEIAALPDTDWHLHRLYDFVPTLGARTLYARFSRYVVDLNRPRDRQVLYPGRFETSVVPEQTFAGKPIYRAGAAPPPPEIAGRLDAYWQPYHARLRLELEELRKRFGYALLFDAHSITSVVPKFHQGELPGLMLGDVDGLSCPPEVSRQVLAVHERSGYSFQANQPFKGGYITRAYGRPAEKTYALQLEMSQRLYMDEAPPFEWRDDLASKLRPVLVETLRAFMEAAARVG